jgi:hydrogenase assembly chaperone HypC/HupF
MCLGIPGRVVEMLDGNGDQLAMVDVEGVQRSINVGMLDEAPRPGEWILIHMGFAMEVIDADKAEEAITGLELLGQAREEAATSDVPLEGETRHA